MADLRKLHEQGVLSKQMVAVVQRLYPAYEKCLHSKVMAGDRCGVRLRKDAENAILAEFSDEAQKCGFKTRKPENRVLPSRIAIRLSQDEFTQLQLHMQREGFATVQDWGRAQVQRYIKTQQRKEKKNDQKP